MFKAISPIESANLELPFSLDDNKELDWSSTGAKSLSLDGFNIKFYKVASVGNYQAQLIGMS